MNGLPTAEVLRSILRYEPDEGRLFWLFRDRQHFPTERHFKTWNSRFAAEEAFTATNASGYRFGSVFGKPHTLHRVAWVIMTGVHPEAEIDHINGNRMDCRWCNLRSVTRAENARNTVARHSMSGITGIARRGKKWSATICADQKRHNLGCFASLEAAISARQAAETRLGFHSNHGRKQQ